MSRHTKHLETLTATEASHLRKLAGELGNKAAALAVGLHSTVTLFKAIAMMPCHSLTISTLRANIPKTAAD